MRISHTLCAMVPLLAWATMASTTVAEPTSIAFRNARRGERSFKSLAVSPNGLRLIVAMDDQLHLIDSRTAKIVEQRKGSPFTMRFTSDGKRLYALSSFSARLYGANLHEFPVSRPKTTPGYLGISYKEEDGRVYVTAVSPGGPVAEQTEIGPGDKIVAVGDGRSGYMREIRSTSGATNAMQGAAGTWLRLRVIHKRATQPQTYTIRRMPAERRADALSFHKLNAVAITEPLVWCMRNGRHHFDSAVTGQTLARLSTIRVNNVGVNALSRDSRRFAVLARMNDGNGDATEVFDIGSGNRIAFIPHLGRGYFDLAFSADGKQVYAASRDTVEILDIATQWTVARLHLPDDWQEPDARNQPLFPIPSKFKIASKMAVSPIGMLATGSTTGTVQFWDLNDGKLIMKIADSAEKAIKELQFSDDGSLVVWVAGSVVKWMPTTEIRASNGAKTLRGFDRSAEEPGSAAETNPSGTTRTPHTDQDPRKDPRLLLTMMTHPIDGDGDECLQTFMEFSPDGTILYVGGSIGVIPVAPAPPEKTVKERSRAGLPTGVAVRATAEAMADGWEPPERPRPESRLERLRLADPRYPLGGKRRSIEGEHGFMPGSVDAYRVADGKWLRTFECYDDDEDEELDGCKAADLSPDGSLLAVFGGYDDTEGELHVFNANTGELLYEFEKCIDNRHYDFVEIAFLDDSKRFLSLDRSSDKLFLHGAGNGQFLDSIPVRMDDQHGLHTAAGGTRFVLGQLRFDARTAKVINDVKSEKWEALAISPDGSQTVGAPLSYDAVRPELYQDGQSQPFGPLPKHRPADACFSPDGKIVAVAIGTSVEFWDLGKKRHLDTIRDHQRRIELVAFSPNGKLFATNARDGATRIWDVSHLSKRLAPTLVPIRTDDPFEQGTRVVVSGVRKGIEASVRGRTEDNLWLVAFADGWTALVPLDDLASTGSQTKPTKATDKKR